MLGREGLRPCALAYSLHASWQLEREGVTGGREGRERREGGRGWSQGRDEGRVRFAMASTERQPVSQTRTPMPRCSDR